MAIQWLRQRTGREVSATNYDRTGRTAIAPNTYSCPLDAARHRRSLKRGQRPVVVGRASPKGAPSLIAWSGIALIES
jgi:hypothetical protein